MDCREVQDILDAYALGATEEHEVAGIEEHVADCIRCWEELNKSQRTAALLALAVPMSRPPEHVESRIMDQARREERPQRARAGIMSRMRAATPVTAGVFSLAAVAALAFAGFLQVQLNDLRSENGALEEHVRATDIELERQRYVVTVLSAADTEKVQVEPANTAVPLAAASVVYNWSVDKGKGFMVCENLPPNNDEEFYKVWFIVAGEKYPMGSFVSHDGSCQVPMNLGLLNRRPDGMGITVEHVSGMPADDWILFSSFAD